MPFMRLAFLGIAVTLLGFLAASNGQQGQPKNDEPKFISGLKPAAKKRSVPAPAATIKEASSTFGEVETMSVEQLLERLEHLRTEEKAINETLAKKLAEQKERLKKLGIVEVNASETGDEPATSTPSRSKAAGSLNRPRPASILPAPPAR